MEMWCATSSRVRGSGLVSSQVKSSQVKKNKKVLRTSGKQARLTSLLEPRACRIGVERGRGPPGDEEMRSDASSVAASRGMDLVVSNNP